MIFRPLLVNPKYQKLCLELMDAEMAYNEAVENNCGVNEAESKQSKIKEELDRTDIYIDSD